MAPRRKALGATVIAAKATNRRTSTTIKTSRATNKRNATNSIDYAHLQITDVLCPLCRNILIEPITLPCQHCFCWRCLQGRILQQEERGTETCPQCQARFGSWYRTAKKQQKLLTNQPLWNAIREMFLKSDNPLYSFLTNGLRKKLPATTDTVNKIANSRVRGASKELLLADGNDSSDSSCAEDSIRRECNHFKPIDIHRGYVSQPVGSIRIPNIIRLPAIRSILCTNGNDIGRPSGRNLFFSDRRLSAFCLVAGCTPVSRIRVQIQSTSIVEQVKMVAEPEAADVFDARPNDPDLTRNYKKYDNRQRYGKDDCQDDGKSYNKRKKLPTTNPTVILLPQRCDEQSRTAKTVKNSVVSVSRSKHKNTLRLVRARAGATKMNNINKRNYRVKEKGAQPQRQSARIVAAAAAAARASVSNNHPVDNAVPVQFTSKWKGKNQHAHDNVAVEHLELVQQQLQQQLQADQQLARQLHRLLNSGATRTTKATQLQQQQQLTSSCIGSSCTVGSKVDRAARLDKVSAVLRLRPTLTVSRVK